MDILDIYSAIITKLRNDWHYTADIDYANLTTQPSAPYIRPVFLPLGNKREEIGVNGSDKLDGILSVDIFTSVGTGIGESSELLGHVMDIFPAGLSLITDNGKSITFKTPEPLSGMDDGHGFYMTTVHCPWFCFER